MRVLLILMTVFILGACVTGSTPPAEKGPGSIFTGKDEQGLSLSDISNIGGNDKTVGLPINALLWRSSLDIVATIPLDDVDTFGGTIVSDWYQLSQAKNERIKIAIFVLDRELRSDGIRVIVYVQNKNGDEWEDRGIDIDMGQKLEELILTRAREIRADGVAESRN